MVEYRLRRGNTDVIDEVSDTTGSNEDHSHASASAFGSNEKHLASNSCSVGTNEESLPSRKSAFESNKEYFSPSAISGDLGRNNLPSAATLTDLIKK